MWSKGKVPRRVDKVGRVGSLARLVRYPDGPALELRGLQPGIVEIWYLILSSEVTASGNNGSTFSCCKKPSDYDAL